MYNIILTDDEMNHLGWLVNHGYFPQETYDGLTMVDDEPEDVESGIERKWEMEESAAWPILQMQEDDPDALFNCTAQPLLGKLRKLQEEIV